MRISKSAVDAAGPGRHYDEALAGFGLYVGASGSKSYFFEYRPGRGRGVAKRRMTLGKHGVLTPEQARREAVRLAGIVAGGADPLADRQTRAETFADLAERYLADHAAVRLKPRSADEDRRMLARYVLPAIGRHKLADLDRTAVARLHHGLRHAPYMANRVLGLLSRMLNLAERWGLRPDNSNPCRFVDKFKEASRERFLSAAELAKLGEVLADAEAKGAELPSVIAAIRLLALTGCRLGEVLTLQWEHVDFEGACLRLPDSKTGAKVVHLSAPALEVLAGLERNGTPWVIWGTKADAHLVNLQKPWRRIRTAAGLEGVRIHDLRHSHASVAVGLGEGLPMIGKLLGHSQVQTTARYAHLATDPVKAATERVGGAIAAMLSGRKGGDVVELPAGARKR